MGNSGGGVANLGVIGQSSKAGGCTGLTTPIGDYFAVDYVAHELGHQFNGNHTFNGTLVNCGGNRSGQTSVEPGSGSSVMAYAGICGQDNIQPHSDPYWVPKSYEEILSLVAGDRANLNEVQNVSFRDFDGTDSFTLSWAGRTSAPIVRGTNFTAAAVQAAIQGVSEVQTVALTGYDANGDSYRLSFGGANSHPIVRGQNNTQAGIVNALAGGNEQQQVTLTNFNGTTPVVPDPDQRPELRDAGPGRPAINNANVATAVNGIAGFAGTVTSAGAGNGGFTLTFAGASQRTDVPAVSIVNCTTTCTSAVRETAKGGTGVSTWPAGATVAPSNPTDTGYTLTISGAAQGTDFGDVSLADFVSAAGTVTETTKGTQGILPAGATGTVAGFGAGTFNDTGFQVTFGGGLAGADQPPIGIDVHRGDRVRRRDRSRRPGHQQGLHRHADRQQRAGRDRARAGDDPAADAVLADRQRHRSRTATPSPTCGSRSTPRASAARRPPRGPAGHHRRHVAGQPDQDQRRAVPSARRRRGHPAGGLAEVQLAGPEPGDQQPDARVPGPGADPGRQHERRDGPVPERAGHGHGSGARPASASPSGCRRPTGSASSATAR